MFINHNSKLQKLLLGFLLIASLTARLWFVSIRNSYLSMDPQAFFAVAAALVNGKGFVHAVPAITPSKGGNPKNPATYKEINQEAETIPYIKNSPGYPLLTAVVWKIFGYTVFPIIYFQVFLTCFCFFLIYRMVARIFNPAVGLLTVFLLTFFNPNELFYTTTYWRDIYTFYTTVISFYLFSHAYYADSPGREKRNYFYTGLVIGIGSLFRATTLFLPVFYALSLPLRKSLKNTVIGLAIMFGTTLLCQTPWLIRNYLVFDQVILTHIGSGHAMMGGIGQAQNSLKIICNDQLIQERVQQYAYSSKRRGEKISFTKTPISDLSPNKDKDINVPYMTIPYEVYSRNMVVEYRKNQPYSYFRQMLKQMWLGLIHDYDFNPLRVSSKYPKWFRLQQLRIFNQIGILAILGFILSIPLWRETLYLAVIPLYFIVTIGMFYVTGRHFIAMEFAYFAYTAYFLHSLFRGGAYVVRCRMEKKKRRIYSIT